MDNLPLGWLKKMKAAMIHLGPIFHSHRMVQEYNEQFYKSISKRYFELSKNEKQGAKELAQWRQHVMTNWDQIHIHRVAVQDGSPVPVSGDLKIETDVFLNQLKPEDVDVELYFGPLTFEDEFTERQTIPMVSTGENGDGNYRFNGEIPCSSTGKYGFTIRIMPTRAKMETPYSTGLVIWAPEEVIVAA
jgi:starch phosphorylase